ncbi:MAG: hypothetical protein IJ011_01910 [Clostridia bacterium]|nr:hypothetical protein [Clostridia bacterium]
MNKYRDAFQHYVTYTQNYRKKTLTTVPYHFVCIFVIVLICVILGVLRRWWSVGILSAVLIGSIIAYCCIKEKHKRTFYQVELFGASVMFTFVVLSSLLSDYFIGQKTLILLLNLIAFVIITVISELVFINKLKNDHYASAPPATNKASIWITVVAVLVTQIILRFLPSAMRSLTLAAIVILIGAFFEAMMVMIIQKLYFVIKYKINVEPDEDDKPVQ